MGGRPARRGAAVRLLRKDFARWTTLAASALADATRRHEPGRHRLDLVRRDRSGTDGWVITRNASAELVRASTHEDRTAGGAGTAAALGAGRGGGARTARRAGRWLSAVPGGRAGRRGVGPVHGLHQCHLGARDNQHARPAV